MGLIDEYKSQKNRELLTMASFKMIKDKFKIDITNDNILLYQNIIKNMISAVSNDAVLINTKMKVQELNNITLVKIKEHIELQISEKHQNTEQNQQNQQEQTNQQNDENKQDKSADNENKISDEDIIIRVKELEEKRRISNMLLQTEGYKMLEDTISSENQQYQNNVNSMNTYFNPSIITDVIHQITDNKKSSYSKNVIINSHSRDWIKYPNRSQLKFTIGIDFTQTVIEPYIIIFPSFVKELTPYVTMTIHDGMKNQKIHFIYSKSNGSTWDQWELMNKNKTDTIYLENKNWNIVFYDYLNKELDIGNDDINILEVSKIGEAFCIKIANNDKYRLTSKSHESAIIKFHSGSVEYVTLKRSDTEYSNYIEYILHHHYQTNIQLEDFINSKLLNLNAQYSIIFAQQKKI